MKYHKLLLTPLGFCMKTRNLFGVKYLLNEKASPTIQIFSNGSKPLDEAAWLGYSNITCCFIDYGALGNDGRSYGALHGAIHKKLHVAVTKLVCMVVTSTKRILEVLHYVQLFHVVFQKVGMCAS